MKHIKEYHKYNPDEIKRASKYKILQTNHYLDETNCISTAPTLEQAYYNTIYFFDLFIKKEWQGDLSLYLNEIVIPIEDEYDLLSLLENGSADFDDSLTSFSIEWIEDGYKSKDELDALSFFWKEDPQNFTNLFGDPEEAGDK